MKTILTISLIFLCSIGMAQKSHLRYYHVEWQFTLSNGCFDSGYSTYKCMNVSYGDIIHRVANWIKPYKIKNGTFKVELIEEISKKEFYTYKGNKFIPCSYQPISITIDTTKWQNLKPMVTISDSLWKTIPDSIRYRISHTYLRNDTLLTPILK